MVSEKQVEERRIWGWAAASWVEGPGLHSEYSDDSTSLRSLEMFLSPLLTAFQVSEKPLNPERGMIPRPLEVTELLFLLLDGGWSRKGPRVAIYLGIYPVYL